MYKKENKLLTLCEENTDWEKYKGTRTFEYPFSQSLCYPLIPYCKKVHIFCGIACKLELCLHFVGVGGELASSPEWPPVFSNRLSAWGSCFLLLAVCLLIKASSLSWNWVQAFGNGDTVFRCICTWTSEVILSSVNLLLGEYITGLLVSLWLLQCSQLLMVPPMLKAHWHFQKEGSLIRSG